MNKIEILAMAPLAIISKALEDQYVVHRFWENPDLEKHGPNIRAIATNGPTGVSASVLEKLPAVEIISVFGVGVDAIDLPEAKRRGIAVATTQGVLWPTRHWHC